MYKSALCNSSAADLIVKETLKVPNTADVYAEANNAHKKVIRTLIIFSDRLREIDNTQIDNNSKDLDAVMLI